MQHNDSLPHSHLRPQPHPGGHLNSANLSGLTSPPHSFRHGPQQQYHPNTPQQHNQFTMRSKQDHGHHLPPPLSQQQQQHQHQQAQRYPLNHHTSQQFAALPQRAATLGPGYPNNTNNHHEHLTNQKSQTLTSPTKRLDITSSPSDSPHSTMESKKGRSRSSSQSTPHKTGFSIKRSEAAPVTIQGWLYKQGSEGLMLWKKRWFVLSEFCLFYYKSPDEERCSGSILLPSYKISPVSKEDGIFKKFAFKAEHQNMRTYYFAAESKDSMSQWMNALSLASICQHEQNFQVNCSPNSNLPVVLSPNGNTSQFSPRPNYPQTKIIQHHYPPAVHQMYSANGNAYQYEPSFRRSTRLDSSELEEEEAATRQPLYANAPPKPKRLNTSRERDTPSPDRLRVYQVNDDSAPMVTGMYQQPNTGVHRAHVIDDNTPQSYRHRLPQERRTPEAYGRATLFNARPQPPLQQQQQHYEDMYNANNRQHDMTKDPRLFHQHQQQLQPFGHGHPSHGHNQPPLPYPPPPQTLPGYRYPPQQQPQQHGFQSQSGWNSNQPPRERVPRPHSADFLEYERQFGDPDTSAEVSQASAPQRGQAVAHPRSRPHKPQPPRPKSCIDQRIPFDARGPNEDEGMNRIAPTTPTPRVHPNNNGSFGYPYNQFHQLHVENGPSPGQPQTPRFFNDSQTAIVDATNEEIQRYFPTPSPRKSSMPHTPSTYQNIPVPNRSQPRLESVTPNPLERPNWQEEANGEFRRSSSARLHRNKRNHSEIFEQLGQEDHRKKEQREESMKRLLEWKQRMLQSPLTRKSSRNASRTQTPTNSSSPVPSLHNNDNFRQKVLLELENVKTPAQTPAESRKVSRKGSGASRSSRNRSSPRISNRPPSSSSDEDISESGRDSRQRRRNNSSSQAKKDANNAFNKPKVRGNLLDVTAQDLLGKSHEELVLMLIHLRRQAAALNEAIDASRAELQNVANSRATSSSDTDEENRKLMSDLRMHIKDLEEKRSRGQPIISLVDNMVKLGSLYRGPQEAPLSHRVRNIPIEKSQKQFVTNQSYSQQVSDRRKAEIQDLVDNSVKLLSRKEEGKIDSELFNEQQQNLVRELEKVRLQLQASQLKLDDVSSQQSRWEHDILILRQQLQSSASRDMQYGLGQSAETLNIESELALVHQKATDLHRRRTLLSNEIESLTQQQDYLVNEIRPSPSGVAGAEPVPSRKKKWTMGWVETDLDSGVSVDRAGEVEEQLKKEYRVKKSGLQGSPNVYVNTFEEEEHGYENFDQQGLGVANPYEDDVQTVHSEGVRSEADPPPLPTAKRPTEFEDDTSSFTLGDISEADDRVKKFFGILPRDNNSKEIKTVRMVKRDSKERNLSKSGSNCDEDEETSFPEPPPPTLPRGNYQNLHDFLNGTGSESRSSRDNEAEEESSNSLPKTNFKLGEYYKRKYSKDTEKVGNGLSAHERLFGSSREASISPLSSPEKSSSRVSSTSPITSPIFKSAAARAIIEEVGKTGKKKKRSLTITGSHPAVMEALNGHQAKMLQSSARSRDDLDMEQALRPRGQNTPDVIRSALDKNDAEVPTIDNLFGAPDKIVIPERYIPEIDMDNQTPEERQVRLKKVDSIRRMLAEQSTQGINRATGEASFEGDKVEERKQREQLLELNHLIAKQVMEKSRMVAVRALANRKFDDRISDRKRRDDFDDDDDEENWSLASISTSGLKPAAFPVVQKRDNVFY